MPFILCTCAIYKNRTFRDNFADGAVATTVLAYFSDRSRNMMDDPHIPEAPKKSRSTVSIAAVLGVSSND